MKRLEKHCVSDHMQLVLADDLALVREKYKEVIEHTKDMNCR